MPTRVGRSDRARHPGLHVALVQAVATVTAEDAMRARASATPSDGERRTAATPPAVCAPHARPGGEVPGDPGPRDGVRLDRRSALEGEAADAVDAGVEVEVSRCGARVAAHIDADVKPRVRAADHERGAAVAGAGSHPVARCPGADDPGRTVREVREPEAEDRLAGIIALQRLLQLPQPVRVVPIPA